jgi:hypothetical protein
MFADEHVQIAAHEDHQGDDDRTGDQANTRGDIHGQLQRNRRRATFWGARGNRSVGPIKFA